MLTTQKVRCTSCCSCYCKGRNLSILAASSCGRRFVGGVIVLEVRNVAKVGVGISVVVVARKGDR